MGGIRQNQQTAWGFHKRFIYTRIGARWVLCPAQSHWIHPHDCFGLESVVETDDFRWYVAPHFSHPHSNVPFFRVIDRVVRPVDDCIAYNFQYDRGYHKKYVERRITSTRVLVPVLGLSYFEPLAQPHASGPEPMRASDCSGWHTRCPSPPDIRFSAGAQNLSFPALLPMELLLLCVGSSHQ